MKSGNHAAILDLRKAYDKVDRKLLAERCFEVLSPNTARMVQSSLGEVTLRTVSDVTNVERSSLEGVVQGANSSPPLFNIFIDPLAEKLHRTSQATLQKPRNQLFADDVALFVKTIGLLERTLAVCTSWAQSVGMQWNVSKSNIILNGNISALSRPLFLSNEPIRCVDEVKYLGVSLTSTGITSTAHEERAMKAEKILQTLRANRTLSPETLPQRAGYIFSTFIRSRYIYALQHAPLSRGLLNKDRSLLKQMYVALLRLRNPPTNNQLKLLNGLFRIDSIQLVREHLTHNFTSKIIQRCNSDDHLTNSFGRRDRTIIESRSPYNLMHRAILNPLDKASQTRQKFVIWNYARKGRRSPPTFTKKKWSLATRVGHHNKSIRLMAIRWHLGLFPFFTNNPPPENHTLLLTILRHHLCHLPAHEANRNHIQAVEECVLNYLNHS